MYTIHSGNTLFIADRVFMIIPDGGSHVRQCYIRAPYLFKERLVVTVTVSTGQSSTPFCEYGVEFAPATDETLFKVSALNVQIGVPDEHEYWCDFIMTGELVAADNLQSQRKSI